MMPAMFLPLSLGPIQLFYWVFICYFVTQLWLTDWMNKCAVTVLQIAFVTDYSLTLNTWRHLVVGVWINLLPLLMVWSVGRQATARCHRSRELGRTRWPSAVSQPRGQVATWQLMMTSIVRSATGTTSRWKRAARRVARGRARLPRRWTDCAARTRTWNGGRWNWMPSWRLWRTCCCAVPLAVAPQPRTTNHWQHRQCPQRHRTPMLFLPILTLSALTTSTRRPTADTHFHKSVGAIISR